MPIALQQIVDIYEHIQEQINIDYVSVVIYTAIDIDSLCSLKMISKFFKGESIQFHAHPVTTYTEMEKKIEQAAENYKAVKMFMFINCGGFIDLTEKWFVKERNDIKVFLFDANKPMNHKNLEHKSIIVVDDEHSELKSRFTGDEMNQLEELEELDIEQSESEEDSNDISPKRSPQKHLILKKVREKKRFLMEKLGNYYGSTFISAPTSYILYKFIRRLNKAGNYALWYAIIGATSLYLENLIPRELFNLLSNYYTSELVQFNPQGQEKKEKGEIFSKKGYNFPLMNHWSLYESMMNSPYLMVKLALWKDQGVTRLHQILTKLGISLEQSRQNYKYMLKELKESLQTKIFTIASDYGLQDISYQSFMRQTDSSSSYMASDFYYIISAVLEKPVFLISDSRDRPEQQRQVSKQQKLTEQRIKAFWSAYNILEGSQDMIKQALEQFKEMSAVMMKEVRDILERDNLMHIGRKLDFSNIRCDTKEKKLFEHQSALMRLGHILMGIQRQKRLNSERRESLNIPYVVSLLDIESNNCLVVGVVPDRKNSLGERFNVVVDKLQVKVQHDRFMSNVIIIPKESLLPFILQVGEHKKD